MAGAVTTTAGASRPALGVGVLVFLVVLLVGYFALSTWDRLSTEEATLKKQLASVETDVRSATKAADAQARMRETATIYQERVQLNRQTAQMLQQVQRLPGYGDITVKRVEGMPLRDEDGFYRSGVSLQFRGNLSGVTRFLKDVEAARPTLKVERLTMTAATKENGAIEGQVVIAAFAVVLESKKA
jgi:Tfp pilus assembly protein PilO